MLIIINLHQPGDDNSLSNQWAIKNKNIVLVYFNVLISLPVNCIYFKLSNWLWIQGYLALNLEFYSQEKYWFDQILNTWTLNPKSALLTLYHGNWIFEAKLLYRIGQWIGLFRTFDHTFHIECCITFAKCFDRLYHGLS